MVTVRATVSSTASTARAPQTPSTAANRRSRIRFQRRVNANSSDFTAAVARARPRGGLLTITMGHYATVAIPAPL